MIIQCKYKLSTGESYGYMVLLFSDKSESMQRDENFQIRYCLIVVTNQLSAVDNIYSTFLYHIEKCFQMFQLHFDLSLWRWTKNIEYSVDIMARVWKIYSGHPWNYIKPDVARVTKERSGVQTRWIPDQNGPFRSETPDTIISCHHETVWNWPDVLVLIRMFGIESKWKWRPTFNSIFPFSLENEQKHLQIRVNESPWKNHLSNENNHSFRVFQYI